MWWWLLLFALVIAGSFGALWVFAQEEARTEELQCQRDAKLPGGTGGRENTGK